LTATAGASGSAQTALGPCPEGYCWYVERISSHGPTAGTKLDVDVADNNTANDPAWRMDFSATANDDIADEQQPIYVPAGHWLVFNWSGATSGDILKASVQYAVHQLDTHYLQSAQDIRQEQASHEKPTAPVTHVAVAEGRAV